MDDASLLVQPDRREEEEDEEGVDADRARMPSPSGKDEEQSVHRKIPAEHQAP
jgi:hypothetical protein